MPGDKAARAGIGYTVANVLIRGIGFITLPIFSRVLDTHDFGVYNVFIAYDSVLVCLMGFALHSSVKSANWQFPGQIDRYVSTVSLAYIVNAAIFIVIAVLFGPQISILIGLDAAVIVLLVLHSFGAAVISLYNARISLQYSYAKYMVVATINSVGNIALSLFLIFCLFDGQRLLGRVLGATIVVTGLGLAIIVHFWRSARPSLGKGYLGFGLKYSLPIVPHGVSQVVLAQFDRLMINYMVSAEAAGVYGLAANLMVIMTVLTDSISTVWTTWFYETMEGESADDATGTKQLNRTQQAERGGAVRKRSGQLMYAFAIGALGLMALAPEVVWVLGGDAYVDGAYCAFGMILSGYCVFLYNLVVVGEYYKQQTRWIMIATVLAALIDLVLNYFAINAFGYMAAAYTTLAAYVFYVLFHWRVSSRLLGFSIIGGKGALYVGLILACGVAADFLLFGNVAARILVNVVFALLLAVPLVESTGGVSGLKKIFGK